MRVHSIPELLLLPCAGSWVNCHSATGKRSVSWVSSYNSHLSIHDLAGGVMSTATVFKLAVVWWNACIHKQHVQRPQDFSEQAQSCNRRHMCALATYNPAYTCIEPHTPQTP